MSLLKKNSLPFGLALGLLSPVFGIALVFLVFEFMVASGWMDEAANGWMNKRMRTTILIGICTNIYWIQRANQPFLTQQLRGITLSTMVCCLAWFAIYYSTLYDQ